MKSKIATAGPARPALAFPRLRIRLRNDLVLGPGKIQLIQAIDRTGSISAAARELGMSYRRAWLLVDALNRMFSQLVIRTSSGGAQGGGAKVTAFGRAVAAAYLRAEERTSSGRVCGSRHSNRLVSEEAKRAQKRRITGVN